MKLTSHKRTLIGKQSKALRKQNLVPGVLFGPKRESTNVQVDKKDLLKLFKTVGYSKFFDLEVEGESKPSRVLIKELQRHPLGEIVMGVNFYQVDEDRKITVEVPVKLVGESPAIKQNLGFLIEQMSLIAVYCLPKDLPNEIIVDISTLENTGDAITIADITLPENVELDSGIENSSAIVYIASAQKEEVVETPAEEAVEGTSTAEAAGGEVEPKAEGEAQS